MSTLRGKLFIPSILTSLLALMLVAGTSVALTRAADHDRPASGAARADLSQHATSTFSGEPDSGGQGAPSLTSKQHAFSIVGTNLWAPQPLFWSWLVQRLVANGHVRR